MRAVQLTDRRVPAGIAPLRATLVVGLGSVATVGLSVIAAKAYALLIGPSGVGLLALMQSVLNIAATAATLGLVLSTIRATASAATLGGRSRAHGVEAAALLLAALGGGAGALLLLLLRDPIAQGLLGSSDRGGDVALIAVSVFLSVVGSVQVAVLSGLHRVVSVVAVNIGTSLAAAAVGVWIVATLGTNGIAPALAVTAAVQLVLSRLALGLSWRRIYGGLRLSADAGELIRQGIPVAASQLASYGAQMLVPVLVLFVLGTAEVGYYRAAATVSIGYLTFFLAALAQDFYPRISGTTHPDEIAGLIERRMRMIVGLGLPLIVGMLAAAPLLVELLYSEAFAPGARVLEWQLVGDMFRLPAWVLSFVLLARRNSAAYLGVEAVGGFFLLAGTFIGLLLVQLPGSGIGYAASQVVYYAAVWAIVRRQVPTTPGRLQIGVIAVAAICSAILIIDADAGVERVALGAGAVLLALTAWPRIYRLHRASEL